MMQSELFGSLAPSEILRIQKIAVAHEMEPGTEIIKPGDLVSSVYLIVVGKLSFWKAGVQIGRGDLGDPFGAVALTPRVAGELVRVDAPTIVLELPLAELHTLFASESVLAAKVALAALGRVSTRLYSLTDRVSQWRSAGLIPAFGAD
jgi:signal-transduction protein with cAMP-binding, CBS, and nucleotidyltransferase domain